MKTVIYHSADFDGICCREIAKIHLGEKEVQYFGWNFGDPPLSRILQGDDVLVMDLPPDEPFGLRGSLPVADHFTWIDHHKSAIESFPNNILGLRIDGVAACRLAWQWFLGNLHPTKDQFVNHEVSEPMAVRLIGEYDVWDRRDPNVDRFQLGLSAYGHVWRSLLENNLHHLGAILEAGNTCQRYVKQTSAKILEQRGFKLEFEGLRFIACDGVKGSLSFESWDHPSFGHDALMAFYFNGSVWVVSMYHARHQTGLNLSAIAKKHGGGGHWGACGFQAKTPFFLGV